MSIPSQPDSVQVALPLPIPQTFTYRVPEALRSRVMPGHRAVVPFGNRILTGVIVNIEETPEEPSVELRDIIDLPDEIPALTPELLKLTRWMADYYLCSWGEAIRAALPSGIELESQRMVFASGRTDSLPTTPLEEEVLAYLIREGPTPVARLQRVFSGRVTAHILRRMERGGLVHIGSFLQHPRVRIKTEAHVRPVPELASPQALRQIQQQLRGARQKAILDVFIQALETGASTVLPRKVLLQCAGASAGSLTALIKRGILEQVDQEVTRSYLEDEPPSASPPPFTPHPDQEAAIRTILEGMKHERYHTYLLHGVTGSGKTAVYIEVLHEVLASGKTGIVLVPEIALTPQTVQRFRKHFGEQVAVMHSRMSAGERYDAWRAIRHGQASVVIGPRSAVLAPVERLGLIVVDEEHEPSYKQFDPTPRYHAREVAIMRAYMNNCLCILGSATPSLESYFNAMRGKYTLIAMPRRVPTAAGDTLPLPDVRLVDLRDARKKRRMEGPFSRTLLEAIDERLTRGEQIILLQNRRGFAPVVECPSCGWSPRCQDCAVTMTYHRSKHQLRCHYCGRTQRMPSRCPECQEPELELLGTGTQRVEEDLQKRFPEARILRMDLDTTGKKHAHSRILEQFRQGKADILLGTQMVAKGLDFHRVTLVGVIQADTSLLLPDFRAGERTFQLLTQVAGRAGRGPLGGEVILQTRYAEHPAIRYAARHDYESFARHELQERKAFFYPPYGYLIGLSFRGTHEASVESYALAFSMALQEKLGTDVSVLGPEQAFVYRIKKLYRYQTLVRAPLGVPRQDVKQAIREVETALGPPPRGVRLVIDVDPHSFI